MMTKQPRQGSKQIEPACYKCGKKGYYAPQCRMGQEPTCFKCGKKGHRAPECRSNSEMPPTCIYCNRVGHTTETCFVRRRNEAVDKQDVRFLKPSAPAESKRAGPSGQNDIMFVQENELVQEDNTVAAFKRSADGETEDAKWH